MPTAPAPNLTWPEAYRMRWKRRRLLWRSFRSRHQLLVVADRTNSINPHDILLVMVQRNETARLPFFLEYYRRLGVAHFLVVDNASDDGSDAYLAEQSDVSLWRTPASYHASRFGLDWLTWLQMRYAHGHWCLTADADELLVYDQSGTRPLEDLVSYLDKLGQNALGALMVDLFPKGAIGSQTYRPGQNPTDILTHFDDAPYRAIRQRPLGNLWVQGGPRERVFFAREPSRAPTLNKLPLVRWSRRYAYVNSSHSALPPRLNALYDGPGDDRPSGALLHTKFLPEIVERSEIEKDRRQHFHTPSDFDDYYDQLAARPVLWHQEARRYTGPESLVEHGLISRINWQEA